MKQLLAVGAFMQALRQSKTRIQAGFLALETRAAARSRPGWAAAASAPRMPLDARDSRHSASGSTAFLSRLCLASAFQPRLQRTPPPVCQSLAGGEVWRPSDDGPPSLGAP
ncbi:hypothetical protein ACU4GD_11825 [Cupriavidus basilensis]